MHLTLTDRRHRLPQVLAVAAVGAAMLGTGITAPSSGDLATQITVARSAAQALKAQIAIDGRQIASTGDGLSRARAKLAAIESDLDMRVDRLRAVQTSLLDARDQLVNLENRLHYATTALASDLVAGYEGNTPDLVSVILSAHGFSSLLDQVSFMQRVARHNATIVGATRAARNEVSDEALRLASLENRDRTLAVQVLDERNQAAALQSALLDQELTELAHRSATSAHFHAVSARLGTLEARLNAIEEAAAAAAARAAATGNAGVDGITIDTGGMVQPPAGAPEAVDKIIAAGNAIATLPYIWGGGHSSFEADGYDCSGSVSYVLAAAGLISSPEVSGWFEGYGDPGPGQWITIYANAGHVWMTVAGWRFDTVALAEDGTRWSQGGGEFAGFVERHPPGL
jgi:peptidoglycan hydrolase CwlO-like protein